MSRLLLTCLLLGTWSFVAAAETKSSPTGTPSYIPQRKADRSETTTSPTTGTRYVAEIKFLRVADKRTITIETGVAGTKGMPLKTDLVGPNGLRLKLDIRDIADTRPTQYLAKLRLTEVKKDGKKYVLCEPRIITVVGHRAELMVGEGGKDRTEFELLVKEGAAVNRDAPKPAAQKPTNKEQSQGSVGPEGTTSLMKMVSPRIIIQEEEEEKLGVPLMP